MTHFALPNLVIAGAPKCGTSSVHEWLSQHPDALGSTPKETAFFCDAGSHIHDPVRHISNGIEGYAQFFARRAAKVVFESTPAYLYHRTARELLPDLPSNPRFLFILREPSAQLYSLYSYYRDNWDWVPPDMSFASFIDAVRTSTSSFGGNELCAHALANAAYVDALSQWRERIGAAGMKVMLFDQLVRDPRGFMHELSGWLGIDASFFDRFDFTTSNETYAVRSRLIQKINLAVRGVLVPLGPVHGGLRRLYRKLNTTRPQGPSPQERIVMQQLRAEFAPANDRLAQAFALDLSGWR